MWGPLFKLQFLKYQILKRDGKNGIIDIFVESSFLLWSVSGAQKVFFISIITDKTLRKKIPLLNVRNRFLASGCRQQQERLAWNYTPGCHLQMFNRNAGWSKQQQVICLKYQPVLYFFPHSLSKHTFYQNLCKICFASTSC